MGNKFLQLDMQFTRPEIFGTAYMYKSMAVRVTKWVNSGVAIVHYALTRVAYKLSDTIIGMLGKKFGTLERVFPTERI